MAVAERPFTFAAIRHADRNRIRVDVSSKDKVLRTLELTAEQAAKLLSRWNDFLKLIDDVPNGESWK